MSIADSIPGMKPGSTGRNMVVGGAYGLIILVGGIPLLALLILASPIIAAVAVGKNYKGAAEKLSGLPGIDPDAGLQSGVVAFVSVVLLLSVVGAVVPSEDTEGTTESAATPTPTPDNVEQTETETQTEAETETETPAPETETEAPDPEPEPETETPAPETEESSSGEGYQVRISYDGSWQGALGKEGSTRSVDGSGTETFDIEGDAFVVSANAQKQDSGSGELTIEILKDGEVVSEQSTTAEYGVASTSTTE